MKRSLVVFICSTYSDLVDERVNVIDAISRLKLQYHSMEFFGARPNQPIETCLEEVRHSDILLVIVGHRYGSFVPDLGISYTEAEYSEGYRLGKPCLVYIRDENVPVLPKHIERNPDSLRALENFKATMNARHTVAQFQSAHDLSLQVAADLVRTIEAIESAEQAEEKRRVASEDQRFEEIRQLWKQSIKLGVSEEAILSVIRQAISSLLATEKRRPPLVFLSYSQSDKEIVRAFAEGLRREGIEIWYDEERLSLGASLIDEISRGLDSADFLAFFISKDSIKSKWALEELNAMMARRISGKGGAVIIPVLLEDIPIPALLRDVKYLDLRKGDVDRGVKELSDAIFYHAKRQKH
jgi:chorismate mutase